MKASGATLLTWNPVVFEDGRKGWTDGQHFSWHNPCPMEEPANPITHPDLKSSGNPPPQGLQKRLVELEVMALEAKQWHKHWASAQAKHYWNKEGSADSQWEVPEVIQAVTSPEYTQELAVLKTALEKSKTPQNMHSTSSLSSAGSDGRVELPDGRHVDKSQQLTHDVSHGVAENWGLVKRKGVSCHHNSNHHATFIRKFDLDDLIHRFEALGFPAKEMPDGSELDIAPPYWKQNHRASVHVPQFFLVLGMTPPRQITIEFLRSGMTKGTTSFRMNHTMVKDYIADLIAFFGKVGDISGPVATKSHARNELPTKAPRDKSGGAKKGR